MTPPTEMPPQIIELLRSKDELIHHRLSYAAFVGMRYPYLYLESPKSACTTTKGHLWRLEGLGPLRNPNDAHYRLPGDVRPSLLSIERARAVEAMCGPSFYRFCVWRDPVRRLASCYMAKIRLGRDPDPRWIYYQKIIAKAFGLALAEQITFDHFARFVCALPDEKRDPHFRRQWQLTLSQYIRYDRIVRTDRYAEGMAAVYDAIGVPRGEWPDFSASRENATGSETIEISHATAAMIRDAYRQDYDMLDRA